MRRNCCFRGAGYFDRILIQAEADLEANLMGSKPMLFPTLPRSRLVN